MPTQLVLAMLVSIGMLPGCVIQPEPDARSDSKGRHNPAMILREFDIHVRDEVVRCLLAEPSAEDLAAAPELVLVFSGGRKQSITDSPYAEAAEAFVAAGHRAVSFDLPWHADRTAPGESGGIESMCKTLMAGQDPFEMFVQDGIECITECVGRGLAPQGRVFVIGTSRGGYCALRLAAAEPRVHAAAAIAPVTDWRFLQEFAHVREDPVVAATALEHWADDFAGRPVYVVIGNADRRVATSPCARFIARVLEIEAERGSRQSAVNFHITDDSSGHSVNPTARARAVRFLLVQAQLPPAP